MTEFTIRLANRPGRLAAFAGQLASAGVNVEALAAFAFDSEGIVRIIVDDPLTTRRVLAESSIPYEEREVVITTLPNQTGALADMAQALAEAEINIDAMYLLNSTSSGLEFAVVVNQVEPARARLGG
jgi:hypothetical protein